MPMSTAAQFVLENLCFLSWPMNKTRDRHGSEVLVRYVPLSTEKGPFSMSTRVAAEPAILLLLEGTLIYDFEQFFDDLEFVSSASR